MGKRNLLDTEMYDESFKRINYFVNSAKAFQKCAYNDEEKGNVMYESCDQDVVTAIP